MAANFSGMRFAVRDLVYAQVRGLQTTLSEFLANAFMKSCGPETVLDRDSVPCSAQSVMLVAYFVATTGEAV
jgi:hypothetical protein